ncbi:MAG: glutamine synthetase type III, partial [Clostridia bacterium]|nr:glutamine synthetase type III [Clostridia bacterium]
VIQAVDDYQDLLRISVATAGNDHRLGFHEAPPAIISVFLGTELTEVLESIENDAPYNGVSRREMAFGVPVLPAFFSDTTDRNRTSPFAYTGNKFEFRMLGSSNSIACANIMLNAAVAESLRQYADELEQADNFGDALHDLLKRTIKAHKRIIFNGNGYDDEWKAEAHRRGLSDLPSTPDCLPHILDAKNVRMLTEQKVFTEAELRSRYEILLGNYVNIVNIEAATMLEMARRDIMPAVSGFSTELSAAVLTKKTLGIDDTYERTTACRLSELLTLMAEKTRKLQEAADYAHSGKDITEQSLRIRDNVLPAMQELRAAADEAETLTDNRRWPLPTYAQLMFGV